MKSGERKRELVEKIPKHLALLDTLHKGLAGTLHTCLNFLVPPRCINCNSLSAHQVGICATCWQQMRFIEKPFCDVMGTPFSVDLGKGIVSAEAIASPPPFNKLRSAVVYDDIARRLVSRFKFADRSDLAPFIASAMMRAGTQLFDDADALMPLPLHWRRFHARRYNQSAELARIIATEKSIPYMPLALARTRNTKQQIGLSRTGRSKNVSGAFTVPTNMVPQLAGKHILLIDDVYTSGASVKSATRALLRGGAKSVDVLTFAKVHTDTI